jgi:hypothetical protein
VNIQHHQVNVDALDLICECGDIGYRLAQNEAVDVLHKQKQVGPVQ